MGGGKGRHSEAREEFLMIESGMGCAYLPSLPASLFAFRLHQAGRDLPGPDHVRPADLLLRDLALPGSGGG